MKAELLIKLFNDTFAVSFNTVLQGGASEPEYIPAGSALSSHKIVFTRDHAASAMHEIAHWSIAGLQRRQWLDYGYWYAPDGRTVQQQQDFERVEVKPQALEWLFAEVCGMDFRVSADNLDKGLGPSDDFKRAIVSQAQHYCCTGLPKRAQLWLDTLKQHCGVQTPLRSSCYSLEKLMQ